MSDPNPASPALSGISQEVEQYQQGLESQVPSSEFPSATSSVDDTRKVLDAIRMKTSFKNKGVDSVSRTTSGGTITTLERHLKYAADDDVEEEGESQEGEKKLRFGDSGSVKDTVQPPESKGMRFAFGKSPTTCERFLGVVEFAKIFVDNLLEEAILKRLDRKRLSAIKVFEGIEYTEHSESLSNASIATYVCIFDWPTIEDFNVDCGISKISEYLSFWKFEEDWKYCINFLYGESDAACDYYRYEAIFSIPCKQYPIPQATASVFFTFEISRVRPKHCLIDVYYCFEGHRQKHSPESLAFKFHEDRLFHIVDAKLRFFKTLTF